MIINFLGHSCGRVIFMFLHVVKRGMEQSQEERISLNVSSVLAGF